MEKAKKQKYIFSWVPTWLPTEAPRKILLWPQLLETMNYEPTFLLMS